MIQSIIYKSTIIFLSFISILISNIHSAQALMPPMTKADAIENSNVVIEGQVISVKKVGPSQKYDCSTRTPYTAKIQVNEIVKGQPAVQVFVHYDKVALKRGCVGQPYSGFKVKDSGLFYLKCSGSEQCGVTYRGRIIDAIESTN